MDRPSFEEIYMRFAWTLSRRSTCSRLQVGAVIVSADYQQVLSIGYNGNARGLPNKCDSTEPGACGCLHAEENAVIKCTTSRDRSRILFTTDSPCKMCAKRLINLGLIDRVYYDRQYRNTEGLELLTQAGIRHEQVHIAVQGW